MNKLPIHLTRKGALDRRELQMTKDRNLQKIMAEMKDCVKKSEDLNRWLLKNLDLPTDGKRRFLANMLSRVLPGFLYDRAPEMGQWIAEQTNAADIEERLLRTNANNVQEIAEKMTECAKEEDESVKTMVEDIKTAYKENWSARDLQEYITEEVGLSVSQTMQDLLDDKYDFLTPEAKEKRRAELLRRLENLAVARKKVITDYYGTALDILLDTWTVGVSIYYEYTKIIKPVKILQESAEGAAKMNIAAYAAKDVVKRIIANSVDTLRAVAKANVKAYEFAIASPDTVKFIEDGSSVLIEELKALEEAHEKTLALSNEFEDKKREILALPPTEKTVTEKPAPVAS